MKLDPRKIVSAAPQKEFFISMLVRDIDLVSAIVDLVDNSVDGARRIRPTDDLEGLKVELFLNGQSFVIKDNCGGIDASTARDYAFKFGRPEDVAGFPRSVGRFGVGMKRALFKLGKNFSIHSTTSSSEWTIDIDVEKWKEQAKWEFHFSLLKEGNDYDPNPPYGTSLEVTHLHPSVATLLDSQEFKKELAIAIGYRHSIALHKSIAILINSVRVKPQELSLKRSPFIQPASWQIAPVIGGAAVHVKLFAGVAKGEPQQAGWYVFCNDRMLLVADKTNRTGWGEKSEKIPAFHNQYSDFRGYVFFESEDPDVLPWNTTKTDVDENATLWVAVRLKMIQTMHPVIRFLDLVKREKEQRNKVGEEDAGPLESQLRSAESVSYTSLAVEGSSFQAPTASADIRVSSGMTRICFERPRKDVQAVKRKMGASTNTEVGERCFDYWLEYEGGDEDE